MLTRKSIKWTIISDGTPKILRNCRRCQQKIPFVSSGKFRVNGNNKLLDVWLIYKCELCENTWNREIIARTQVNEIDSGLLNSFQGNDRKLAEYYAATNLPSADIVAPGVSIHQTGDPNGADYLEITIEVTAEYPPRIDQIISHRLALSRSAVTKMIKGGNITSSSTLKNWYRKPPFDGQKVFIDSI